MICRTKKLTSKYAVSALAITAVSAFAPGVTQGDESSTAFEEPSVQDVITITARKKEETILEAPLSVQAFSGAVLNEAGLVELEAVSVLTPNLNYQNLGNSQPGRFNTGIRFRGMDSTITTPTNQTGAFFVDGISVLGGAGSVDFSDIGAIEIIRGPQPVFFGRGTFGGAINYVTVDPGEDFGGRISASYSPTFGSTYLSGYVEGQLAEGLTGRLTGFAREKGAQYTATDGGSLGEEKTDGLSAILSYKPNDRLSVKTRLAYSEDTDGPASTAYLPFREIGNISLGTPLTVNTTTGPQTGAFARIYYEGVLPSTGLVSSNTTFYDINPGEPGEFNIRNVLLNEAPSGGTPSLSQFGLKSEILSASLAMDYDLSDSITLSGLFGYNEKSTTQIRDTDLTDAPTWAAITFLELESYSLEGRVAYDNGGPLRLTGGVNYASADQFGDIDGGYSIIDGIFGGLQVGYGNGSLDNVEIETLGIFGAVEYDIQDWITIALEGRQQFDDSTPSTGNIGVGNTITQLDTQSYDEFLPRAIVTARPFEGANFYLSYAEGTLPGVRNSVFDALSDADRTAAQLEYPFVVEEIDSETLETYELGWKQSLSSIDAWFSAILFTQEWSNMKSTGSFVFTSPTSGDSFNLFSTLAGDSSMDGFEFEGNWAPTDALTLQASYGYVDAKFDNFVNQTFDNILGLTADSAFKADGNSLPRSPKHSGAIAATWEQPLVGDWSYRIRTDIAYQGESYLDELNLTKIDDFTLVNARLAFENINGVSLEIYCNNCLNEEGWATGRRLTDFSVNPNFFTFQGAVVDPIDKFETGVRASIEF